MSLGLCWELKKNGLYCKNYRLKNKKKCRFHKTTTTIFSNLYLICLLFVYIIVPILLNEKISKNLIRKLV